MQRYIKIVMLLFIGLFGLMGAIHNILAFEADTALVAQVVTGGNARGVAAWQKIETPFLVWLCWSVIPLCKFAAGVLCLAGTGQMWTARSADAAAFQRSKQTGLAGCGVLLAMLFGVFILITETWFQQWQTELGGAILPAAHRYLLTVGILTIYIQMSDD